MPDSVSEGASRLRPPGISYMINSTILKKIRPRHAMMAVVLMKKRTEAKHGGRESSSRGFGKIRIATPPVDFCRERTRLKVDGNDVSKLCFGSNGL